uniref:ATP synthase complex subunit 8 n=1 Tax=Eurypegasus draconis TaxID=215339 RepID=A7E1D1_9TELE|nr:ATP synthase F0 subunit 8 [Eurypegasus draconis]BAF74942.1 ATPase subunit 8 [Eurypegasus draconis]
MPQLNPSPWFLIMLFSWLVLLVLVFPKIMQHTTPNEPLQQDVKTLTTSPWTHQWQ